MLVDHFLSKFASGRPLSEEAMACLMDHDSPGNVGELMNIGERAAVLRRGATIRP